jgi:hypothetical protein
MVSFLHCLASRHDRVASEQIDVAVRPCFHAARSSLAARSARICS